MDFFLLCHLWLHYQILRIGKFMGIKILEWIILIAFHTCFLAMQIAFGHYLVLQNIKDFKALKETIDNTQSV